MHSYRVYSLRHPNPPTASTKTTPPVLAMADYSTVPIKPILMCFVCKLSFGGAKSFVAHAEADHRLRLDAAETDILQQSNTSAILQLVGKSKEPVVSFLEPTATRLPVTGAAATRDATPPTPVHSPPMKE